MITQFPTSPKPRQVSVTSVTPTYKSTSHSLRSFVRSRGVQAWSVELEYPPMTRSTYAPMWAFQMQQRGQYGDFEFILPEHEAQGVAGGSPAVMLTSNLFASSENFDSTEWTPDADLEQNGTTESHNNDSAQVWIRSTGSSQWENLLSGLHSASLGQSVVFSVYLKNTHSADRSVITVVDHGVGDMAKVNIYWDGTAISAVSETSGSAYSPGFGYTEIGDGWYRVFATATAIASDCKCYIFPACDATLDGDGDGLAVFGAQIETDIASPSYYKPTIGTAIINELPTGRQLGITGWSGGVDDQLKAGDFVKLTDHRKVYMVTEDCDSDSAGFCVISIEPALTHAVTSGEVLVVEDVPFRMRFADDVIKTNVDRNLFYGWNTKLVEAL